MQVNETEIANLSGNKIKILELEEIINSKDEDLISLKIQLEREEANKKLNSDKNIILMDRIDMYIEKIEKVLQK